MIKKYYHTLKYLKPGQTFGRFFSILKKRFLPVKAPSIPAGLISHITPDTEFLCYDPWNKRNDLIKGTYCFLNSRNTINLSEQWDNESIPLLWRFNFHYFNYLHLLNNDEKYDFCINWITENPIGKGTGWHAYPLSLRIVNWIKAGINDKKIFDSIYQQAYYLYRNLEFYFPGNHYLENAKALYFAARFFEGQGEADIWLKKSKDIFYKELPVQVLSDGGYFERSPMYHAIMLSGFLDMYNITTNDNEFKEYLSGIINKMLPFQKDITHPNGEIALFNDSTTEIAPQTKDILNYAERLGFQIKASWDKYPETGYYIFKNNDIYLVVDGGAVGPDYLPAHSHADIFSYELSVKGEKIITDTGVFEYKQGKLRDYIRSTSAHNTVCIDDTNQVECWDSFRLARRYKPENVSIVSDSEWKFDGEYFGYSHLIGDSIRHKREIQIKEENKMITISDIISGNGSHLIKNYIHLIPGANIKAAGRVLKINYKSVNLELSCENIEYELIETEYYPYFGKAQKRNTVLFQKQVPLPFKMTYEIKIL